MLPKRRHPRILATLKSKTPGRSHSSTRVKYDPRRPSGQRLNVDVTCQFYLEPKPVGKGLVKYGQQEQVEVKRVRDDEQHVRSFSVTIPELMPCPPRAIEDLRRRLSVGPAKIEGRTGPALGKEPGIPGSGFPACQPGECANVHFAEPIKRNDQVRSIGDEELGCLAGAQHGAAVNVRETRVAQATRESCHLRTSAFVQCKIAISPFRNAIRFAMAYQVHLHGVWLSFLDLPEFGYAALAAVGRASVSK